MARGTFSRLVEETQGAPETVILYHGTSSNKLKKFVSDGIKLPTGDVEKVYRKAIMDSLARLGYDEATVVGIWYAGDILESMVKDYVYALRASSNFSATGGEDRAIFTAGNPELANSYAQNATNHGSELYTHASYAAARIASEAFNAEGSLNTLQAKASRFREPAYPIVVGIHVPVSWTDLGTAWDSFWVSVASMDWGGDHVSFQSTFFMKKYHLGREVLVLHDVPPSNILWGISDPEKGIPESDIIRIVGR